MPGSCPAIRDTEDPGGLTPPPGPAFGMADVATVLRTRFLKFDPADPTWFDRDRFVCSQRPLARAKGIDPAPDIADGPTGQGLATAVGMALAERLLNARFGDLIDHRTWVIAGEGDLMEGISHEAMALAAQHGLSRLCVLFEDKGAADILPRLTAAGWAGRRVDGHDPAAVEAALRWATEQTVPVLIACRTRTVGETVLDGVADDIEAARDSALVRHGSARQDWQDRLSTHPMRSAFATLFEPPREAVRAPLAAHIADSLASEVPESTRAASERVLARLVPYLPGLIGGAAEWPDTLARDKAVIEPTNFSGRQVRYGRREFGMAAAMNGLAIHGGLLPYGATGLALSDHGKAAIRLGAVMRAKAIHLMTHESSGDGPACQPVEHLAGLRAIPGLLVLRPADAVETAECWKAALTFEGPSAFVLSEQALPRIRTASGDLALKGAYELKGSDREPLVSIFASGSEVHIALLAQARLDEVGIPARVVSTPCWELFDAQDDAYRAEVLGTTPINVAIEAAARLGWEKFIGRDGIFVGMTGFGVSAPANRLYRHMGITAEAVVQRVGAHISAGATIHI